MPGGGAAWLWNSCLYLSSGKEGLLASGFGVISRPASCCSVGMLVLELKRREVKKGVLGAVADGNTCRVEGQSVGRDGSFGGVLSEYEADDSSVSSEKRFRSTWSSSADEDWRSVAETLTGGLPGS